MMGTLGTLCPHKKSLDCYEGPKSLVFGSGVMVAHHHCWPDLGNGGVDPAGQYSNSGFGVDCCCDSDSFDCDFDPDSFHFDVGCCSWNMP